MAVCGLVHYITYLVAFTEVVGSLNPVGNAWWKRGVNTDLSLGWRDVQHFPVACKAL